MNHYTNIDESLNPDTCRICFEPETSDNPLIAPCRCTGSSKYIHEKCLNTWRYTNLPNSPQRRMCMECNYHYRIEDSVTNRDLQLILFGTVIEGGFYYFTFIFFGTLLSDWYMESNDSGIKIEGKNISLWLVVKFWIITIAYIYSLNIYFYFYIKTIISFHELITGILSVTIPSILVNVSNYYFPTSTFYITCFYFIWLYNTLKINLGEYYYLCSRPVEKILNYDEDGDNINSDISLHNEFLLNNIHLSNEDSSHENNDLVHNENDSIDSDTSEDVEVININNPISSVD